MSTISGKSFKVALSIFVALTFLFSVKSSAQWAVTKTTLNTNKVFYPSYGVMERSRPSFPDVSGYKVMLCDFHTHTIFSDGLVWPDIRVSEAWSEGLDAIAITDHIEYRPFKKYTNNDHNTSYDIAKVSADKVGLILVKGSEITRTQRTMGHFNALFLNDSNPLDVKDPKDALRTAKAQGAYIIWNHPGWAVDSTFIRDFQREVIEEGLIDAIEIFNNTEFYPVSMRWAIEKNLAMIAASDAHGSIEKGRLAELGIMRPLTIVLAKERTLEGLKEGLKSGRTLAYFHNIIAAKRELAIEFVNSNLHLKRLGTNGSNTDYLLDNKCDIPFHIKIGRQEIFVPKSSSVRFSVPSNSSNLKFTFMNIFVNENELLAHDLQIF